MNGPTIITDIPATIDPQALMPRLHLRPQSPMATEFLGLAEQVQRIARPKAAYLVAYIDDKTDDSVVIDGVRFTSRVLRVNLDPVHRVFAYIATCGLELYEWAASLDDVLHQFWAEELKAAVLREATSRVFDAIAAHNQGKMASMNPGSLPDWPLPEQRPFFQLMGAAPAAIGVSLNDSCLMTPNKSVTGFRFANESSYVNCQLCPREGCPGRAAPYDATLFAQRYAERAIDEPH